MVKGEASGVKQTKSVDMDTIVSLCKRRGFIFQSSEIYGGLGSCWDYGPLGAELKRNVKEAWWKAMVHERDDVVGLDSSILMHPQVWVASGHVQQFADPLVECKSCNSRFRADHVTDTKCPQCGGELGEPRMFNLMFKTFMGPVENEAAVVYLRPETAQGIFVNFQNALQSSRKKLPFGIAQMGKSFRNEITTGNFIFRSREFEQMEMEYFVKPGTDGNWFQYWLEERFNWYLKLGIKKEHLQLREHGKEELAHYAIGCYDVEYLFPMGWSELEGIANRGSYDLEQHAKHSGKDLGYFDDESGERFLPYIIEPSAGVDRSVLAFLLDAYDEEVVEKEKRVLLRLHPDLAPVKVAVLPLSRNEKLVPMATEVNTQLRRSLITQYDDSQSIGRRYRRQDEIGTPYCVTIDFQSLEDHQVTIRDRDSLKQIRVPAESLKATLTAKLDGEAFDVLPPGGTKWLGF
jgi:glycyl-tRNA synthetase